jgi:Ca2+:H+ antiporter
MGFLLGGIRHGTLRFDPREAGRNSAMMLIALASLLMPAAYWIADRSLRNENRNEQLEVAEDLHAHIGEVSVAVSIILIVVYVAYVGYSFTREGGQQLHGEVGPHEDPGGDTRVWSRSLSIGVLVAATAATVVLAEMLVGTVEHIAEDFELSELFVGVIVVPIIGNVAEHFSAVIFAYKNKPDVAQAIAAGSSTQVALLVAPAFVLISYALGNPMDLVFSPLEIIVIGMSGFLFSFISNDGESNWLEAVELLGLYAMGAIVFYFLPF